MRACHVLSRNEDLASAVPVRHVLPLSPLRLLTPTSPATQVSTHASVDAAEAAATVRELEIGRLRSLCAQLRDAPTLSHKLAVLDSVPDVRKALSTLPPWLRLGELPPEDVLHIKQLAALRQWHVLDTPPSAGASLAASGELLLDSLAPLLESMRRAESFYDILGGVVGYQLTALELIQEAEGKDAQVQSGEAAAESPPCSFLVPRGHDLTADPDFALRAAAAGLAALPRLAELYPLGGAGDRLGLVDEATGEPLPVALLPYGGHTLLAWLLRDLAAREYLHFRLYGAQVRTPVAVMTSQAKGNHSRVKALCEQHAWFGRGEDGFRLFQQPLVPVVAARTGRWLLSAPGRVQLKPGGHGAVWKLAADTGVLDWLERRGVQAVLVRQISNPLAATDTSLLALAGVGASASRAFGFMSCERAVGAAEGMNVLVERRIAGATPRGTTEAWEYNVSNLEYTEFDRLGVEDVPREGCFASAFPANTNVLYVALSAIRAALARGVQGALPGMLINLTKPVAAFGEPAPVQAGRLECSMQNLADALPQRFAARLPPDRWADLSTFCVFALRRRVTSSAKRRRLPGDSRLAQTPEGSFLDLLRNGRDMLALGGVSCPEIASNDAFLREGRPGFLLRHHPALGPLWHVAAQKVRDSRLQQGAELELELAEADVRCLELTGSLLVRALQPLGPATSAVEACPPVVHYSTTRVGRARLHGVRVANQGVEWEHPQNVLWAARVARREAVTVIIHGDGEFDAVGVTLFGTHTFNVPAGFKLCLRPVTGGAVGEFTQALTAIVGGEPSWTWAHEQLPGGAVALHYMPQHT